MLLTMNASSALLWFERGFHQVEWREGRARQSEMSRYFDRLSHGGMWTESAIRTGLRHALGFDVEVRASPSPIGQGVTLFEITTVADLWSVDRRRMERQRVGERV